MFSKQRRQCKHLIFTKWCHSVVCLWVWNEERLAQERDWRDDMLHSQQSDNIRHFPFPVFHVLMMISDAELFVHQFTSNAMVVSDGSCGLCWCGVDQWHIGAGTWETWHASPESVISVTNIVCHPHTTNTTHNTPTSFNLNLQIEALPVYQDLSIWTFFKLVKINWRIKDLYFLSAALGQQIVWKWSTSKKYYRFNCADQECNIFLASTRNNSDSIKWSNMVCCG